MNKKRVPVLSVVLYVLSGLLLIYTIWSVFNSYKYIQSVIAQGQLVIKGNMYQVVGFFMSSSAQYFIFAVILFVLGYMLQRNTFSSTENLINENHSVISEETPNNEIHDVKVEEPAEDNEK